MCGGSGNLDAVHGWGNLALILCILCYTTKADGSGVAFRTRQSFQQKITCWSQSRIFVEFGQPKNQGVYGFEKSIKYKKINKFNLFSSTQL
jgi:hypothetical protein